MRDIVPVILCGGAGKRLWPFSTPARPKPFLKYGRRPSMLQATLLRMRDCGPPILVANQALSRVLLRQVAETGIIPRQILFEPARRNTAPALAAAALAAQSADLLLVLPCDHAIRNPEALMRAVLSGKSWAQQGRIVAFGIRPRYAETGFGYICRGGAIGDGVYNITRFIEKPVRSVARALMNSGDCDWNSGIFLLSAATALEELEKFEPRLLDSVRAAMPASQSRECVLNGNFTQVSSLSIDVAVMERSDKTLVIPVALDWHDLGSFRSVFRAFLERVLR